MFKPYIRPIVRGKAGKKVEFGAKVNMAQVDGINFIEHLNYEAFHEGIRMWRSILKHNSHFDKCSQYAGDQIYANNKNRKYARGNEIVTSFKKKGRPSKIEDPEKAQGKALAKARSTILEGSFGNEKNHYGLRKIKGRSQFTETAWIFFGIHTANAVKMVKKMNQQKSEKPTASQAA